MNRIYFIPYQEKSEVNYTFIFCLYKISGKNPKDKLNNYISFTSIKDLSNIINDVCRFGISSASISRILNNHEYKLFFTYDKENKIIILNNNFQKSSSQIKRFIILNQKEIDFLIQENENLLNKYYLYIKYFCNYNKSKKTDFTAEQFLFAVGYSHKSGNNKSKLSNYNNLLCNNNFIIINQYRDINGKIRNIYTLQKE